MSKDRIWLGLLLVLAAAVRVYVEQSTGFQFDDAWITYRYAENLAAGNGFVYNPGEYVEGSTAPLLVVLLSLPAGRESRSYRLADPFDTCERHAALPDLETLPSRMGRLGALLAVAMLGFSPSLIVASASGMETTLFIAFLLSATVAYCNNRPFLLGSAIAALVLTRIDGLILVPSLVAAEWWVWCRGDRRPVRIALLWRAMATALVLLLPWMAVALSYFGDVVPNSIWAKVALYRQAEMDVTPPATMIEGILTLGNVSQHDSGSADGDGCSAMDPGQRKKRSSPGDLVSGLCGILYLRPRAHASLVLHAIPGRCRSLGTALHRRVVAFGAAAVEVAEAFSRGWHRLHRDGNGARLDAQLCVRGNLGLYNSAHVSIANFIASRAGPTISCMRGTSAISARSAIAGFSTLWASSRPR